MSLSFKDSSKKNLEDSAMTNQVEVVAMSVDDIDDGNWQQHADYVRYPYFSDNNITVINDTKDITLNKKQFNITQEENSQYIPFEMPRYYDGFDLIDTVISIHYQTKNGRHGSSKPVNVFFNDEKIRFGWLIDAGATIDVGTLEFEIHAYGSIAGSDGSSRAYTWKTKRNKELNVLESLCDCEDVINNIDDTWLQELITDVAEKVADEIKNVAVGEQVAAAEAAAESAKQSADSAKQYAENSASAANTAVNTALRDYATTEYVDDAVASVDVSEQLESYVKTADLQENYYNKTETEQRVSGMLENYATKDDVANAITEADISEKLNDYYTKSETYSKTEVDNALDNVQVDLTGYATESYVNTKTDGITSSISTNAENISSLSKTVGDLQDTVNTIDTSPRLTYDVAYNDTEDEDVGENVFVFYEIENEGKENEVREAKKKFTITGGSGGATSSSLKIGYVTTSPLVVTVDDKAIIKYTFSGTDSSGDAITEGTATWKVAGRVVATNTALNGENEFDVTDYLSIGTQKVNLSIVDEAGSLVTKTWNVQKIDVRLESTFNDKITYPIGKVSFDYTPYGAISKEIHFVLDGKEIDTLTTAASGIPMAYEISAQEHGSHLFEVYMTAEINGNKIESNHIVKDILWYDGASSPVIGTIYQEFTARQYDTTNIVATIYDPTTETPTVTITVDDVVVSTQTLTESTLVYPFKTDVVGEHIITITCGETVKTLTATVTKLDIDITPVTAGLAFDFNPSGKSNNDVDRVWTDGTTSMSVSDNFDWINGGYQFDENGDQYFCIKAGTSATIDYQLFADDAKKNGKEFKLVFKTTNVAKPDATFLYCMDNTTDSDHIGIQMDVHEAFIYGQSGRLHLPYSEEDIIEFEFNISKNTESIPMVMGYEDGVSTAPMVYDDSHNFTQNTPKIISLGSEDCDLYIYRFKVYNTSLTDRGILNNFIADARNAEEMISRYDRNQIYDENQNLDPDVLAEKCPWLRIIKIEAPYFTNNKSDKVPNTTIEHIYKGGDPILDNWKAYDSLHSGQGTSSNNYGAAGRNLDLIIKSNDDFGNEPYIVLGDGSQVSKVALTRTSVPVNYFNVKVNIASSENANNALLQRRYNQYNPYNRAFVREEGYDTSIIKDTMEFANCVVFIKETNTDLSTHREFADNDWHFYAIGNMGDSKKTDSSRLTDPSDRYECCVEIMDVELRHSDFPTDENAIADLQADNFDEKGTYGFRYIWEDGTDEENAEVFNYCKQKWIEFYEFVITSTDEEFKASLGNYFVLDSALYYYLFTNRYLMIDNRAKNTFWHYGKTGEVDASGNPIRKWDLAWDYDNDSSLGINNYGDLVYRYGLEDTDVDDTGGEVFRESDSTFFCRLRDLFVDELKAMYQTLESQNAWHGESLINQFDEWQAQFPEELWRVDIERKYIRTYNSSFINGEGDSQFLVNMAKGKKKYQRRQFERNQEKYMASKYQSSVASSDNSVFRCSVPTGDLAVQPNYRLKLTPYAYMYLNVKYGTQEPIQLRAEPNVTYEIPFEGDKADIVDVYSSSLIQDFGDLSTCYVATADTTKASKVKKLIFGNSTEGYDNPNFTTLTTGANYLLEELNIENVSGLTQSLNLSALSNLKELYAHGSNVGGVTFADGGKIEIAELPAINALTMKNLIYLTSLDITNLRRLTTLTVENCNTVDLITMLNQATNVNRVRIVGIDWNLTDTSLLERLYAMKGIDKNGYNTDQSVLTGTVTVPVIGQYELYKYQQAWSDLTIVPTTVIKQFAVTFVNDNGDVLDIQYVDQFGNAVDPITREENPIATPTKESTISHDYTYAGWNSSLLNIIEDRTITATYTESLREYTAQYVSKGVVFKSEKGLYGDNIICDDIPTYTAEEPYTFYLFNRWDKSGFLDNGFDANGVKTINAIFDRFEYTSTAFVGKELEDLSPVEIYAMNKLGLAREVVTNGDDYSFSLGYDFNYDDIESVEIIGKNSEFGNEYKSSVKFNGSNYFDTGIQLFDEDKDFILAIDYEFNDTAANSVLTQCYQGNGSVGFKLQYNNSAQLKWGSNTADVAKVNEREMIVIRHKKGDSNLTIYGSNLNETEVKISTLASKSFTSNTTLVFGCEKQTSTIFTNYANGVVHWAKIWYKDLGEDVCKNLALWTHENIGMRVCGFNRYYLSDNPDGMCNFSLIATHLLERTRQWNKTDSNVGGWAMSALNTFLNTRLYNAIPTQIKALVKPVVVWSSVGGGSTSAPSTELSSSSCYIAIPSLKDMDGINTSGMANSDPYNSESFGSISLFSTSDSRKMAFDGGEYEDYWLRSPAINYPRYVWRIEKDGSAYSITQANSKYGVLIELSF